MAKNEAKIRFTAETGGFNSEIKKSNEEMSRLRAEMNLNNAQMKTTGASVETLENKHRILSAQLAASEDKTQALSQKVNKAAEIFGENSTEVNKLRTQLLNAQTAEEKIRQAINACNDELEAQKKAEDQTESATEKLTSTIDKQQTELDKLKREYVDAALQHGKNSKEAKDLAKQIDSLSGELENNKRDLNNAEEAADKFDNSLDKAGESAEGFDKKMAVATLGVAAAAAAMVEFGKSAMEAFNEVDEGADNVIKATGATGAQAEALEESYSNVAKQVVGDFGDIGSALGEVNTRFGYTGEELENASIKFQKFSEITGVDSTEAVQSVSRALNDAGIPLDEYDTLLDQLAKAGQTAGIDVTTLTDSLSENGSIMRSMGFDTQETIALLSQFELSGANTSVMLTGMKKGMAEWAKEGKDGSKEFAKMVEGIQNGSISASDAIDVFGTKAGPMLVDAIKSGKFEYQDMLATIQNSKGTVESTFDGTVDGGYEMELAMQNCKMALAEVGKVVGTAMTPVFQALSETVIPALVDGFSAFVEGVKSAVSWMSEHKALMTVIASVIGVLVTAITAYNIVQGVKNAMDAANVTTVWALVAAHWAQTTAAMAALAPYILIVAAIAAVIAIIVLCIKYWDEIVAAVKKCWDAVCATLSKWGNWINQNVIQPIVKFFSGLWDGIRNIFANLGGWFKEKFTKAKENAQKAWSDAKQKFGQTWSNIKSAFSNVGGWFKNQFAKGKENAQNAWSNAKAVFSTAWNNTKSAFSNVGGWFKNTFTKAKDGSVNAFSNVKSRFSNVVSNIKSAFSNVKSIISKPFEAARDAIKGVVDKIKGFFSGLKLNLPKIKLPHFKITGSFSLNPPSVPKLSIEWYKDGGIMMKPTIFGMNGNSLMAGGEAGPEAILPIDRLEGYISGAIEKAQNVVNLQALADAIEDLANRPIQMNINGRQFATATANDSDGVNGLRTTFKNRGLALG